MARRSSPITAALLLGLIVGLGGAAVMITRDHGTERARFGPTVIGAGRSLEYRVTRSLPLLTGSIDTYRLGVEPGPGALRRVAAAFGVQGEVRTEGDGWAVGQEPGPVVHASRTPGAPWVFTVLGVCPIVPGAPTIALPPGCLFDAQAPRSALPSVATARRVATSVLARLGVDTSDAAFTAIEARFTLRVEVAPTFHGRPTSGFSWYVAVDDQPSVKQASGWLAAPQVIGRFPLIGVDEALRRSAADSGPASTPYGARVVKGVELGFERRNARLVPVYRLRLDPGPDIILLAVNQ